jgi:hypothetical protein
MELQVFISKALAGIFAGIETAQKAMPVGAIVPAVNSDFESVKTGISELQTVDFEVVVRVDESKGTEAKLTVAAALVGGFLRGNSHTDERHTTKLKFRIPVRFHSAEKENARKTKVQ